jgi:hypothetical protein
VLHISRYAYTHDTFDHRVTEEPRIHHRDMKRFHPKLRASCE